ncbi:MAG TPA: hypothetical protein VLI90_02635, partial [Tepidisphaeraceae bacterium]|nr:hypothetical protein [Tepidisphaeraceae bacterium]
MSFNPNLFPRNDCRAGVIVATLLATLLAMRSIVHADPTLLNVFANSGVGAETTPIYVTAGANGNVTVVDPFLGQLAGNVYAPDGNYRFTLLLPTGEMGLSNGAAFGVTAADGSVYVADHSAGVAVFSPTGVQQRIIAGGVVQQPSGIAVTDSLVYVTNRTSIAIYTTGGTSVGTFGSVGSGPGQFNIPNGIALDSTATNLYLADQTNN